MKQLSIQAQRVIDLMKRSDNFLTMSQFRLYQAGVDELLDIGAIIACHKDGLDGYRLLLSRLQKEKVTV